MDCVATSAAVFVPVVVSRDVVALRRAVRFDVIREERLLLETALAAAAAAGQTLGIWGTSKCCCFVGGSLSIHAACNHLTVGPH